MKRFRKNAPLPKSVLRQQRMLRPSWWRPVVWTQIAKLWPYQEKSIDLSYRIWKLGGEPVHSMNLFHLQPSSISSILSRLIDGEKVDIHEWFWQR